LGQPIKGHFEASVDEFDVREIRRNRKKVPFIGKTLIIFLIIALIDTMLAYGHIGMLYTLVLNR